MKIITTLYDLENFIDTSPQLPQLRYSDVMAVVEAILSMATPAWGADWEEFLRTLPWTVWTRDRLALGADWAESLRATPEAI